MINIDIFATSDIHGHVDGLTGKEGFSKSLSELKKYYPNAIFVDNGDYFIGSLKASYYNNSSISTKDNPLVTLADKHFDIMNLGNHDIDYGIDRLKEWTSNIRASYLCANILDKDNKPIFKDYTIIEKQNIKVAFLGIVTKNLSQLVDFNILKDYKMLSVLETLDLYLEKLKNQADLVIVLYHGGLEKNPFNGNSTQYDTGEDEGFKILESYPLIDGLIMGHQHRETYGVFREKGTAFVQASSGATSIGHISFQIDEESKAIKKSSARLIWAKNTQTQDQEDINFESWLDRPLPMKDFEKYLKKLYIYDNLLIEGQIKSIRDLVDNFKKPFMVSSYYMTKEELIELGIRPKEEKEVYILLSNDKTLPYYRIKEKHIDNIIDGYVSWLKNRQ